MASGERESRSLATLICHLTHSQQMAVPSSERLTARGSSGKSVPRNSLSDPGEIARCGTCYGRPLWADCVEKVGVPPETVELAEHLPAMAPHRKPRLLNGCLREKSSRFSARISSRRVFQQNPDKGAVLCMAAKPLCVKVSFAHRASNLQKGLPSNRKSVRI